MMSSSPMAKPIIQNKNTSWVWIEIWFHFGVLDSWREVAMRAPGRIAAYPISDIFIVIVYSYILCLKCHTSPIECSFIILHVYTSSPIGMLPSTYQIEDLIGIPVDSIGDYNTSTFISGRCLCFLLLYYWNGLFFVP
jgi:hypothetical protein